MSPFTNHQLRHAHSDIKSGNITPSVSNSERQSQHTRPNVTPPPHDHRRSRSVTASDSRPHGRIGCQAIAPAPRPARNADHRTTSQHSWPTAGVVTSARAGDGRFMGPFGTLITFVISITVSPGCPSSRSRPLPPGSPDFRNHANREIVYKIVATTRRSDLSFRGFTAAV